MTTVAQVKPENLDSWFQSLANEALDKNNKSVCVWSKYKNDLEETKRILTWLPGKLKHSVMVPLGPKALMRGKIVHTNEILTNLGDSWFVKRSAQQTEEMCDRRIQQCCEVLQKLEKEKELLESKKSLPVEKEAFGSEDRPEIIEYVTEEEEQEWRRQHRLKEKEYRQKLAEMRSKGKKPIETEADLWNHLDELELQEELEDELNRLNLEEDGSSDDESEELKNNLSDKKNTSETSENKITAVIENESVQEPVKSNCEIKIKRRVSFANLDDSSGPEPLRLEIRHCSDAPNLPPFTGTINTPADIYEAYIKNTKPCSVLKNNININKEKEMNALNDVESDEEDNISDEQLKISPGIILRDVSARAAGDSTPFHESNFEPTRKISKFKAARMKKTE